MHIALRQVPDSSYRPATGSEEAADPTGWMRRIAPAARSRLT
jgi:hypothetical protein